MRSSSPLGAHQDGPTCAHEDRPTSDPEIIIKFRRRSGGSGGRSSSYWCRWSEGGRGGERAPG